MECHYLTNIDLLKAKLIFSQCEIDYLSTSKEDKIDSFVEKLSKSDEQIK